MNEMLGNQYFLTGRFKDASTQFERTLLLDPSNNEVKKKLIICYIQQSELKLALKIFTNLISKNIEMFLSSNTELGDCPCKQMIYEIENYPSDINEIEKNTMLGILWFYCNPLKSKKHFDKLLQEEPNNSVYQQITELIKQQFLNKRKVEQNGKKRTYS